MSDGPERATVAQLRGVTRTLGGEVALDAVDLALHEGAVTVVIGAAGAGKTTLLRAVAGLDDVDGGEIHIGGVLVAGSDTWVPAHRRQVGWAGAALDLFDHLDVEGNVGFSLPRGRRSDRVGELLRTVGLYDAGGRRVSSLSNEEARRVAWARAVSARPQLVLLDEPLSGIDAQRPAVLRDLLGLLRGEGATVLLATRDPEVALAAADEVAVLVEGRLLQVGPPETVYRDPVSPDAAVALGDANLLEADVRAKVAYTAVGPLRVDAPDGHVLAVVRPEDLTIEVAPRGDGRIVDAEYFGHGQRLAILLDDGTPIRVRLHAARRFATDARVRVRHSGVAPKVFSVDRPATRPQ